MHIQPFTEEISNLNHGQRHVLETFDLAEVRDTMTEFFCAHHLRVPNAHKLNFRHTSVSLSSLQLSQVEYGTETQVEISDIEDFYVVSLPICGTQEFRQGDKAAISDPEHGIIISPTRSVSLDISADCKQRMVRISRLRLEGQLSSLLGRVVTEPLVFSLSMDAKNGAGASWWRTIKYLEQERSYNGSLYMSAPFLSHVEQMLMTGLLYGIPHNYTAALKPTEQKGTPIHVYRAERFIRNNAREPISIDDIVNASGVTRRKLYRSFKSTRGIAPIHFLRDVRMQGAREDLLTAGGATGKITSVAMSWGFIHLGRFSVDYKKRFGESPSDTVRRQNIRQETRIWVP